MPLWVLAISKRRPMFWYLKSVEGHKRKSRTKILMSALPPITEVAGRRWHFRYVPLSEVERLVICMDLSVSFR